MSDELPIRGLQKLSALQGGMISDVIRQAEGALDGVSYWQRRRMEWQISYDRAQLQVKLADTENRTIHAEVIIACEARLFVTRERAMRAIFEAVTTFVIEAGEVRDRRLAQAARLPTEGSREMVQNGIDNLFVTYMEGVDRRSRGQ